MAAKRKKVTLNEFKAWLEGVEELQPKDWNPSKEQWKLIRAKIDNIKEEQLATSTQQQPQQMLPRKLQTSIPGFVPAPEVGGIPSGELTTMSSEAEALLKKTPDGKSSTPNIDTTDGNFKSSFT